MPPRRCSGELCKSRDIKSASLHRYTGIDDQVHHRCLTCIPNDERPNYTPARYEYAVVNDVLHKLEQNNSHLDVVHNKVLKKGDKSSPDLLIRDGKKLIALEIDEKQHNKQEDEERRKKLQQIAKDEKLQYYDVRFQVNEHKKNPVVEKIGGIVYKNSGYNEAVDYTANKLQKIVDNKSNTKVVEILANEIKNMNIHEQSSSKECVCGAKQKDGKKCPNKCRSNGKCGKHGG